MFADECSAAQSNMEESKIFSEAEKPMLYDIYVHGEVFSKINSPVTSLSSAIPATASPTNWCSRFFRSLIPAKKESVETHPLYQKLPMGTVFVHDCMVTSQQRSASIAASKQKNLKSSYIFLVSQNSVICKNSFDDFVSVIAHVDLPDNDPLSKLRRVATYTLDESRCAVLVCVSSPSLFSIHSFVVFPDFDSNRETFNIHYLSSFSLTDVGSSGKLKPTQSASNSSQYSQGSPGHICGISIINTGQQNCLSLIVITSNAVSYHALLDESYLSSFHQDGFNSSYIIPMGMFANPIQDDFIFIISYELHAKLSILVICGYIMTDESVSKRTFIYEIKNIAYMENPLHSAGDCPFQLISLPAMDAISSNQKEFSRTKETLRKKRNLVLPQDWIMSKISCSPASEIYGKDVFKFFIAERSEDSFVKIYSVELHSSGERGKWKRFQQREIMRIPNLEVFDYSWWSKTSLVISDSSSSLSVLGFYEDCDGLYKFKNILGNKTEGFLGNVILANASSPFGKRMFLVECVSVYTHSPKSWTEIASVELKLPHELDSVLNTSLQLLSLCKVLPEEFLQRLLRNGEFEIALEFAKIHNLNSDIVYQKQWRQAEVSTSSINFYLSHVKDKFWVLRECFVRVGRSEAETISLYEFGLNVCEALTTNNAEREFERNRFLFLLSCWRLALLRSLELLRTYVKISDDKFEPGGFLEFRNGSSLLSSKHLLSTVLRFIRLEKFEKVETIFRNHYFELFSRRLYILESISETCRPLVYRQLLPKEDSIVVPFESLERPEFSHRSNFIDLLISTGSSLGSDELEILPFVFQDLHEFRNLQVLKESHIGESYSLHELENWYQHRIRYIEHTTGNVGNALQLCMFAVALVPKSNVLSSLCGLLQQLDLLVYACDVDISLNSYEEMDYISRFIYLMADSTQLNVISNLYSKGSILLKSCNEANLIFKQYVVFLSAQDFTIASELLNHILRNSIVVECGINYSTQEAIDICIEAIYSVNNLSPECIDCMSVVCDLCLQTAQSVSIDDSKITQLLRSLKDQVTAVRFFAKFGELHSAQFYRIENMSKEICIPLVKNTIRRAGKLFSSMEISYPSKIVKSVLRTDLHNSSQSIDDQWVKLLEEVTNLQAKMFAFITWADIFHIFLEVILSWDRFELAEKMLGKYFELPTPEIMRIILESSREHFNASCSGDDHSLEKASRCLEIFEQFESFNVSAEIQAERDLIEAVRELHQLDIHVVPYEVRKAQDKSIFFNMALDSQAANLFASDLLEYQDEKEFAHHHALTRAEARLLHLGGLLGWNSPEQQNELRLRLAENALRSLNIPRAQVLCLSLLENHFNGAWELCYKLSQSLSSIGSRREFLLGQVLWSCPADQLDQVLDEWNQLRSDGLSNQENMSLDFCNSSNSVALETIAFAQISTVTNAEELVKLIQESVADDSNLPDTQLKLIDCALRFLIDYLTCNSGSNGRNFDIWFCSSNSLLERVESLQKIGIKEEDEHILDFIMTLTKLLKRNLGISIQEIENMISSVLSKDVVRDLLSHHWSGSHERIEEILNVLAESPHVKADEVALLLCDKNSIPIWNFLSKSIRYHFVHCKNVDVLRSRVSFYKRSILDHAAPLLSLILSELVPRIEGNDFERWIQLYSLLLNCFHVCGKEHEAFRLKKQLQTLEKIRKLEKVGVNYRNLVDGEKCTVEVLKIVSSKDPELISLLAKFSSSIRESQNPQMSPPLSSSLVYKIYLCELLQDKLNEKTKKSALFIEDWLDSNRELFSQLNPGDFFGFFIDFSSCSREFRQFPTDLSLRLSALDWCRTFAAKKFNHDSINSFTILEEKYQFLKALSLIDSFFKIQNFTNLRENIKECGSLESVYDLIISKLIISDEVKGNKEAVISLLNENYEELVDTDSISYFADHSASFSSLKLTLSDLIQYIVSNTIEVFNTKPLESNFVVDICSFSITPHISASPKVQLLWIKDDICKEDIYHFVFHFIRFFDSNSLHRRIGDIFRSFFEAKNGLFDSHEFLPARIAFIETVLLALKQFSNPSSEHVKLVVQQLGILRKKGVISFMIKRFWPEVKEQPDTVSIEALMNQDGLSQNQILALCTILKELDTTALWISYFQLLIRIRDYQTFTHVYRCLLTKFQLDEIGFVTQKSFYEIWCNSELPKALLAAFAIGFTPDSTLLEDSWNKLMSSKGLSFLGLLSTEEAQLLYSWIADCGQISKSISSPVVFKGIVESLLDRWNSARGKQIQTSTVHPYRRDDVNLGMLESAVIDLVLENHVLHASTIVQLSLPIQRSLRSLRFSLILLKRFLQFCSQMNPKHKKLREALQIISRNIQSSKGGSIRFPKSK